MTEAKRPIRVFLCHASQDKPSVRGLYKRLNAEGWIDPWLDEEKLLPGQDWDLEIRKAIREADAILVVLSRKSITKEGYVQKEIKRALDIADEKPDGTIYIIPARLEEYDSPERLQRWHRVDLFDSKGYKRLLSALQRRADALDLEVTPERDSWLERFFKYLGERKEIIFSTLGILVALIALLFGDNIYEQFTGRSIFATKPVPTLTSTTTFTLTSQPVTPSLTPTKTRTPTLTPTKTRAPTQTITPSATITPSKTPVDLVPDLTCTWRIRTSSYKDAVQVTTCLCYADVCHCTVRWLTGNYIESYYSNRSTVISEAKDKYGSCE